ncbi:hypothetical protein BKA62DRAFT_766263 [Auriculariales sp. MPI-PUGE-AT-0066]|nr:hypothetical protein BKA62DRAFT_766263 [Auriculariales sp. MPI-PUGE-AT-0066]
MSRPQLSSTRRPSSAIFLGKGSTPPDLPSPPVPDIGSPASSSEDLPLDLQRTHLPSPPHTNSTGSTGASSKGSVRIADMNTRRHSRSRNEEDDYSSNSVERDEDETARPSDDKRRSTGQRDQGSVQRVLDKIASIASSNRLTSPSPNPARASLQANVTPFPSSNAAHRVSFTRSRNEVDFSGSETEREGVSEGRSSTPPATNSAPATGSYTRTRLVSAPSPHASPKRPAMRTSTSQMQITLSPRTRRQSASHQSYDGEFAVSPNRTTGSATKRRQPLPREFTASASTSVRRSLDGRAYQPPPQTPSPGQERSPERDAFTFSGRGSPSPTGSPATFGMTDRVSPRLQRPSRAATLRESNSNGVHTTSPLSPNRRVARWSSDLSNRIDEDTTQINATRHRAQASEDMFINRGGSRAPNVRPGSSMANGDYDDLPRSRSRASVTPSPAPGRNSTFNSPRHPQPQTEHARLMLDALAMFESQLSRLSASVPSSSTTPTGGNTGAHVGDLLKSASNLAQSASTLNNLMRGGTAQALENQIEAEVGDAPSTVDAGEVWRGVGSDYREALRASDDLVRALTGVLLGVGRVVRNVRPGTGGSEDGGSMRSSSRLSTVRLRDDMFDERELRAERRRTEDYSRSSHYQHQEVLALRSGSRLELRRRDEQPRVSPSPSPHTRAATIPLESRDAGSGSRRSGDSFHSSPHSRPLPQLAIPPPLSTIPSESILRRKSSHISASASPQTPGPERERERDAPSLSHSRSANRLDRASIGSVATVRATPATPAGAVVTPITVSSPVELRPAAGGGDRRNGGVNTAARAGRGATVALNGIVERDSRKRTISGTEKTLPAIPNPEPRNVGNPSGRQRHERRRTATETF